MWGGARGQLDGLCAWRPESDGPIFSPAHKSAQGAGYICPYDGHRQNTAPSTLSSHAWWHNGKPDGTPECVYVCAQHYKGSPAKWARVADREEDANAVIRVTPNTGGQCFGIFAVDDIWHTQEIVLVNEWSDYQPTATDSAPEVLGGSDCWPLDPASGPGNADLGQGADGSGCQDDCTGAPPMVDLADWSAYYPRSPWTDMVLDEVTLPGPVLNSPRWLSLNRQDDPLQVVAAGNRDGSPNLTVAHLNVGGLSQGKVTTLCWVGQRLQLDVLYLLDTRHDEAEGARYVQMIRDLSPAGTFVRQVAVRPLSGLQGGAQACRRHRWRKGTSVPSSGTPLQGSLSSASSRTRIGGLIVIVSPKWSRHIRGWWQEGSGFGLAGGVTLQGLTHQVTVFGTYWPFRSVQPSQQPGDASLWTRLQDEFLTPNGIRGTPREYVSNQINRQAMKHSGRNRHACIMVGDLNGRLSSNEGGSGPVIRDELGASGWVPFLSTAALDTALSGTGTY